MPSPVQAMEGTILDRVETGESHLRISLFSGRNGLRVVLFRLSKKVLSQPPPDLFDEVELVTRQSSDGQGLPFVKDFQILSKRPEIAHNHFRFQVASSLARLFLDNGSHLQDTLPFGTLFIRSLNALQNGLDPASIWFKSLFQFGRLEGLPVKQDWLARLEQNDKEFAIVILKAPLDEKFPPKDRVVCLVQSLRCWLNSETELRC